jgi:hypothetical protein
MPAGPEISQDGTQRTSFVLTRSPCVSARTVGIDLIPIHTYHLTRHATRVPRPHGSFRSKKRPPSEDGGQGERKFPWLHGYLRLDPRVK